VREQIPEGEVCVMSDVEVERSAGQDPEPAGQPARPEGSAAADAAGGVLVAIDGSESSDRALAWAVAEAGGRGVPLTIVHCYYWPSTGLGAMDAVGFLMEGLEEDSREILAAAAKQAAELAPTTEIRTASRLSPPVPTIVEMSRGYELVVLGSRGLGGFKGMLLGSVSTGVVSSAQCPVAIVRGTEDIDPSAPVVVGVDSSPSGEAALDEAFAAARRRGCSVVAVHAWQPPTRHVSAEQEETWQQSIASELEAKVAEVSARFPGVPVEVVTHRDRPTAALLARAQSAQLLVVGTRGRSELKGVLLGSTSRAMVQHAPCPVLVVR
jgi:nucleotide-binding universal stress UspA family protein